MRWRRLKYRSGREASGSLTRKVEFGCFDILGDLLAQGGRLFHRQCPHQRLTSDRESGIQGWTFQRGKSWDREDKLKSCLPIVFEQLLFLSQEYLWPSERVSRKSYIIISFQ